MRFAERRAQRLRQRLELRTQQWEAVNDQYDFTVNYAEKPQLKRLIRQLEAEIEEIETELNDLEQRTTTNVQTLPDVFAMLPEPFEWCYVPGGKVQLHYVEAFAIARYAVTNAQYRAFEDAPDGYRNPRWWHFSKEALLWRIKNPTPLSTGYRGDNIPRTRITFYEALAFCYWLSQRLKMHITLPTVPQWQRAAQGDDQRRYPWGDHFHRAKANTRESDYGRPMPVDDFPEGQSPFGVMNMSGNVWEWCLQNKKPTLRGGSFFVGKRYARIELQEPFAFPLESDLTGGFRIVCLL